MIAARGPQYGNSAKLVVNLLWDGQTKSFHYWMQQAENWASIALVYLTWANSVPAAFMVGG